MNGVKVGMHVRAHVYVNGERLPAHSGTVVSVSDDGSVCYVDRMSLHGGAPWILPEATSTLSPIEVETKP